MAAPGHFAYSGSSSYRKNFDRDVHADTGIFNRLKAQFLNVTSVSGPGAEPWTPFIVNPTLAVSNSNFYSTIQDAIDAAAATSPTCEQAAVVLVTAGTYAGFTIQNEGILIRGLNDGFRNTTTFPPNFNERNNVTTVTGPVIILPDTTTGMVCAGLERIYVKYQGTGAAAIRITGSASADGSEFRMVDCAVENVGTTVPPTTTGGIGPAIEQTSGFCSVQIVESFVGTYDYDAATPTTSSPAINLITSTGGGQLSQTTVYCGGAYRIAPNFFDPRAYAMSLDHGSILIYNDSYINGTINCPTNTSGANALISLRDSYHRGQMNFAAINAGILTSLDVTSSYIYIDNGIVGYTNWGTLLDQTGHYLGSNSFFFAAASGAVNFIESTAGAATSYATDWVANNNTGLTWPAAFISRFYAFNGTGAAPSVTFFNDQDTGIYRPAANQIGLTVNGTPTVNIAANDATLINSNLSFDTAIRSIDTVIGTGAIDVMTGIATIAATSGTITALNNVGAIGAAGSAEFTLANTTIDAGSLVFMTLITGADADAVLVLSAEAPGAGSIVIHVGNPTAGGITPNVNSLIQFFIINPV